MNDPEIEGTNWFLNSYPVQETGLLNSDWTLVDESDAKLLTSVFSITPNLTKCYLEIVRWEDSGWLALNRENLFPPSLATLGLQLLDVIKFNYFFKTVNSITYSVFQSYVDALYQQDNEVFSFSAANHFMTAVSRSSIQFLDFTNSNQHFSYMKTRHKILLIT